MNLDFLIPIVLFLCITYAIKVVVEARMRQRMLKEGGSEELLRSMAQTEELHRRQSSLRWGITLVLLAAAFAAIEAYGWRDVTPGAIAVLVGAVGLGNLIFYALSRRLG